MALTTPERYVVVSCHVERPLDDRTWHAFSELQSQRPGGLVVAALMRPPDHEAGEDGDAWLERAAEAASRGPLGHHTHWTSPTHARPTDGQAPGDRVRRERAWLLAHGVVARHFCGGGWYTDAGVAAACAEAGYVDCTPRATRPAYLDPDERWAQLAAPALIELESGQSLHAIPTTHSAGDALRAALRPGLPKALHLYFHDSDLVDQGRRRIVVNALRILGRRGRPTDLDDLAEAGVGETRTTWSAVARGGAGPGTG